MESVERRCRALGLHGALLTITTATLSIGACSDEEPSTALPAAGGAGTPALTAGMPSVTAGMPAVAGQVSGGHAGTGGATQAGMAGNPAGNGGECSVAGSCEQPCVDDEPLPPSATAPRTLAETGLYAGYHDDANAGGAGGAPQLEPGTAPLTLASYVRHYVPKYPLWSDGASKDRYVYIPKCSTIDTSDMDHWEFPVGTRLWKTFTVPDGGSTNARIETRMLHHYGPTQGEWLFVAYQWNESAPDDPAAALPVPDGVLNANGTDHDIPSETECLNCHGKLRERVLGFGALQLSHPAVGNDLSIDVLSNLGWLTTPAPAGFQVPGTPVQQAALGYLHGNCGGCHNSNGQLPAGSPLLLRLSVAQTVYAETDTVMTTVGIPTFGDAVNSGDLRIAPMAAANSSVLVRMQARGTDLQMPPLITTSTELPDTTGGVADVQAWVTSLP